MTISNPPFPEVIDDSLMSAYRNCPRKFELEYLNHWKPKNANIHFHAGKSYATGLEIARRNFFTGVSTNESIQLGATSLINTYGDFQCPTDSAKSKERTLGAYQFYFERYPLETEEAKPIKLSDGTLGIEFPFLEEIEFKHPETGNNLKYSGRFDMLCDYMGTTLGLDDKTTSSLGATWPQQWDLRSQFTGYAWGAAKKGMPLAGFIVRGVSILKTKYDTMEAITYRPQWMIDRWYEMLLRDLKRMKEDWEQGKFSYRLDDSCNSYGGCIFKQICCTQNSDAWLQGSFRKMKWNPVTREEEILT